MKINAKLGLSGSYFPGGSSSGTPVEEEKVYFREDFVPPEISIVNFFINRVKFIFSKLFSFIFIFTNSIQFFKEEKRRNV